MKETNAESMYAQPTGQRFATVFEREGPEIETAYTSHRSLVLSSAREDRRIICVDLDVRSTE